MFLTKPYKFLVFSKRQNQQKATKTAPAVCSMLQDVNVRHITLNACRLASKLLKNHPGTKYILKQIIHKNIFGHKSVENYILIKGKV